MSALSDIEHKHAHGSLTPLEYAVYRLGSDEAAAELAALQAIKAAAEKVIATRGVIHHGNGWNYRKVKAEELDALGELLGVQP